MTAKPKGRIAPRIDLDSLQDTFAQQIASGTVYDAQLSGGKLPSSRVPGNSACRSWARYSMPSPSPTPGRAAFC
jgi:hypothetical protein